MFYERVFDLFLGCEWEVAERARLRTKKLEEEVYRNLRKSILRGGRKMESWTHGQGSGYKISRASLPLKYKQAILEWWR